MPLPPPSPLAPRSPLSPPSSRLIGDVGGTNTRLALYDERGKRKLAETIRPSGAFANLDEIVASFLGESGASPPRVAVIGVAGPVVGHTAKVTNLPWSIDAKRLAKRFGIGTVSLQNDLVVAARGCLHVPPSQLEPLTDNPSTSATRRANIGVLAAGTGLGEARLIWTGDRHLAFGTEGGHCDFAPQSELEIELWRFLSERFGEHVSYERVLSGDGLGALYDFFALRAGKPAPRAIERRFAETADRNALISELGLSRTHRPAAQAIDLFAGIYGAEAGNLALRELATGGVFVVGNIGAAIVPARRELFMQHFQRKGRFEALLARVPVIVVRDTLVGLRGALAFTGDIA